MTDDPVRALYQAVIVEHGKHPRRRGPVPGATHTATLDNPLCGDVITLRLVVDGDTITDAGFEAQGCALSVAAASMLAERAVGRPLAALAALGRGFQAFVTATPGAPIDAAIDGELAAFVGVRGFRSRQACATLPWRALAAALGR